MIANPVE